MKARTDFIVIPWGENFLEKLLCRALADTDGAVSEAVFLFPNSRPEKYLTQMLRQDARVRRPLRLPHMFAINELFSSLRAGIQNRPTWSAGILDRVGLLLAAIRAEKEQAQSSTNAFAALCDARHFFPWGLRLAALFEECLAQNRTPDNFEHLEGTVSPFAALLLSRLQHIFARYLSGLEENGWATPGYDAFCVARHLKHNGSLPAFIPGWPRAASADAPMFSPAKPCYLAGFYALTGAEDLLLRHFWENQAQVLIHADPALTAPGKGEKAHWSCRAFADWAQAWGAHLQKDAFSSSAPAKTASTRYYQGFDLHSQLTVLEQELAGAQPPPAVKGADQDLTAQQADTVVVLPDSALLTPVLHHLPRTDINISMGYPLSRSPLFRLLDTLIRLQERRKGNSYYWRDLVELFRHPYVKMLQPQACAPEKTPELLQPENAPITQEAAPLRRELHRLEQALRGYGRRYLEPFALLEQSLSLLAPEEAPCAPVLALLEELLTVCLDNFETPQTPGELGAALEQLCALLLRRGAHLWDRFLIDAECLYRILQSLLPEFRHCALAAETLPQESLFALLRQLMQAERVPFEASPLVGLQVMGMLETRLLSFRRVIILGTEEDRLPGSAPGDPLLPEALRPELGLPSLSQREQVSAYHFFRLLAGADETLLLWEEGSEGTGVQEQKKKKSRFVEELLWQEEKKLGRLLSAKGKDGPLHVLTASVIPIAAQAKGFAITPPIRALMRNLLKRPVSASLLDAYLRCPLRFFYQHLADLTSARDIQEGDDPLAVGDLLHQTLQEAYTPWLGQNLPGGEALLSLMEEELLTAFTASPRYADLARTLPADSFTMLGQAGKKRLHDYLSRQKPAAVLSLETTLNVPFAVEELRLVLTGTLDRVDLRTVTDGEGGDKPGIVILDYKTGRLPQLDPSLWQDSLLWQRLSHWTPDKDTARGSPPLLQELAARMESIQLPLYLLLYSLALKHDPLHTGIFQAQAACLHDALWVDLAGRGEEQPLFPKQFSPAERTFAIERQCGLLVDFLLRHMLHSSTILPSPGAHCLWCSCEKLCMNSFVL